MQEMWEGDKMKLSIILLLMFVSCLIMVEVINFFHRANINICLNGENQSAYYNLSNGLILKQITYMKDCKYYMESWIVNGSER